LGYVGLGRAGFKQYREHDPDAEAWLTPAEGHLERAVEIAPGLFDANLFAAHTYYYLENLDLAAEYSRSALGISPGDPQASVRQANAYYLQDRHDEAESLLRAAITHSPDYWAAHTELGLLYWKSDRTREAISASERAALLAPNDVTTVNNLGVFYYDIGEWDKVHEYAERAFHISPNCETCSNMGWVAYYGGDYAESARFYEFAIEYCDTTDFELWGNLGAAQYWADGLRERSRSSFHRAIHHGEHELARDPENHMLIAQLISYYALSGDVPNARRMMRYGEVHAGEVADVLFSIAGAHELFDERAPALRYLGAAMRHGYSIPEIETTPSLAGLVEDPLYIELKNSIIEAESVEPPDTSNH